MFTKHSESSRFLMLLPLSACLLLGATLTAQELPTTGDLKPCPVAPEQHPQPSPAQEVPQPVSSGSVTFKSIEEKNKTEEARRKVEDAVRILGTWQGATLPTIQANWTPMGLLLFTPNNNFQMHVGGWLELDYTRTRPIR